MAEKRITPSRAPREKDPMRELAVVEDAALLIGDGRLVAVGPRAEVEARAPADAEVLDAGGRRIGNRQIRRCVVDGGLAGRSTLGVVTGVVTAGRGALATSRGSC